MTPAQKEAFGLLIKYFLAVRCGHEFMTDEPITESEHGAMWKALDELEA